MNARIRLSWLIIAAGTLVQSDMLDYPAVRLKKGEVALDIVLPDAQRGYYRSTRFDHSGMIAQAHWRGHTFFAALKHPHNPYAHDHGVGTAEEFGMRVAPLGYDEAAPGKTFVKIGVGLLRRADASDYRFHDRYDVERFLPWHVMQTDDAITFVQTLNDLRGYGYRYTKTIRLSKTGFRIERELINTGSRVIETDHYSHNMIMLDERLIGPGYRVVLPVDAALPADSSFVKDRHVIQDGQEIIFLKEPRPSGWGRMELDPPRTISPVQVLHDAGLSLEIRSTGIVTAVELYAEPTAVCPELFVLLVIQPGEAKTWSDDYCVIPISSLSRP